MNSSCGHASGRAALHPRVLALTGGDTLQRHALLRSLCEVLGRFGPVGGLLQLAGGEQGVVCHSQRSTLDLNLPAGSMGTLGRAQLLGTFFGTCTALVEELGDEDRPDAWTAHLTTQGRIQLRSPADDEGRLDAAFAANQVEALAHWVLEQWRQQALGVPLMGLVLTGGRSRRMGQDKALLPWRGEIQATRLARLLEANCQRVYLSARHGQERENLGWPVLLDSLPGIGPVAGIASALEQHPEAAWLVLACDLPLLNEQVLEDLLEQRDPLAWATAFTNPGHGRAEPLCAIWEPRSLGMVRRALALGVHCPRRMLGQAGVHLLPLKWPHALLNLNCPEDLVLAQDLAERHAASGVAELEHA